MELVRETGSLRAAAAHMGMAYMTAWKHMKTLNRTFRAPVIVSKRGGKEGGGAVLTDVGRKVVALYHLMEKEGQAAIQKELREFQTLVKR
jgi:molybdate transport system regulatory protein